MKRIRFIASLTFSLFVFNISALFANAEIKQPNIYDHISHHYLPVFSEMLTPKQEETVDIKKLGKQNLTIKKLNEGEQRNIALSVLAKHGKSIYAKETNVFNESFWADLELFCGPNHNRKAHVAQTWNNTITTIGDIVSKRMLVRPITNINKLKQRQEILKVLCEKEDTELGKKLKQQLKHIKKHEPLFWGFWQNESTINALFEANWYPLGKINLTKNPHILEANSRLLIDLVMGFGAISGVILAATSTAVLLNIDINPKSSHETNSLEINPSIRFAAGSLYLLCGIVVTYNSIKLFQMKNNHIQYMQKRLMAVAGVVDTLYNIHRTIQRDETLKKHIPSLSAIPKLMQKQEELAHLISILRTNTFKGESSYFSNSGKILSAFQLIKEVKHLLIEAVEAVGEVDAYLSMATQINKFKINNASFAFVDYVSDSSLPSLKIDGFWFPQLLHDKNIQSGKHTIVPNSIEMKHGEDGTSNILMTGPNTGGKSTILKAIVTSLLLAQTYGIAPAKSMQFTPFHKIQTYINIPDNAAEGISLFKAELLRVAQLLNEIKALKSNEFAFTILDEVFNGTNPEEAIIGSAAVIETMCTLPNSINIIATHYGLLTELEKHTNGIFKNYKVTTTINPDGTFAFPYTWQPGISDQHIALELIKQEGFLNSSSSNMQLAQKLADTIHEAGIR